MINSSRARKETHFRHRETEKENDGGDPFRATCGSPCADQCRRGSAKGERLSSPLETGTVRMPLNVSLAEFCLSSCNNFRRQRVATVDGENRVTASPGIVFDSSTQTLHLPALAGFSREVKVHRCVRSLSLTTDSTLTQRSHLQRREHDESHHKKRNALHG